MHAANWRPEVRTPQSDSSPSSYPDWHHVRRSCLGNATGSAPPAKEGFNHRYGGSRNAHVPRSPHSQRLADLFWQGVGS